MSRKREAIFMGIGVLAGLALCGPASAAVHIDSALPYQFVTTALENGMDVKTLSTIIGHVSAKTTLNVYTHVTDAMQQTAAAKIDRGIGKCEPPNGHGEGLPAKTSNLPSKVPFEPYKGKIRKPGTGCVTQINEHLWEGKFSPKWPDGKKHSRCNQ